MRRDEFVEHDHLNPSLSLFAKAHFYFYSPHINQVPILLRFLYFAVMSFIAMNEYIKAMVQVKRNLPL